MARSIKRTPHPSVFVVNKTNDVSWVRWFHELKNHVQYLLTGTAVTSPTVDYTVLLTDHVLLVDASAAAVTVTLPLTADTNGQSFKIKKIDSSSNTVTIDGNGSETIDGSTTQIIYFQYDAIEVHSDGTNWYIV